MASVVRYVFGCCIRAHSPGPKEPDERTPFIQPSDEVPPIRTYTVDHDRLKERLGTIVRSKEGKMVNVNQPLPFNLYGRPPHARLDRTDLAPQSSTIAGNPHLPRMPSQSTSREPSPSIQTSRSTSSLHPGDASYLPPEADPEGGSRKPILNVRLVRGPGGFFAGARPRPGPMTRGRPGRPSEERARENGDGSGALGSTDGKGKAVVDGANGTPDAPSSTTAEAHTHADNPDEAAAAALNGNGTHSHADGSVAAQAPESSGSDSEFKIEDVGDIAQSWGD
ncbi:uncharacterized protein TRAVEDRAFT_160672 [Trametes versicolor FP-101664 SS1]|uniref:uncharacterized protein n=1 Tax=Trametes versicolor (strain FP-101664) TaxID=717944 RepID=UPI0004623C08|nr:uncharacterized protein TRAVEDRAFT_160672 [Trametes versicolor FP-101664 SS1]EIW62707.1 hypothetical protein TRAVEDRAFT_160672 [Trametes versicolor FP-101664 SS1]